MGRVFLPIGDALRGHAYTTMIYLPFEFDILDSWLLLLSQNVISKESIQAV